MPSILDRVSMIARANLWDLLTRAEDPEKMLNQILRDMQDALVRGQATVADQIAAEKMYQKELNAAKANVIEWGKKAELAVSKSMDDLAREALHRQEVYEKQVASLQEQYNKQHEAVETLKAKLADVQRKYDDARLNKDSLVARAKSVTAQEQVNKAAAQLNVNDYSSTFSEMQHRIEEKEARVAAQQEVHGESTEEKFKKLAADQGVEDKLAALKQKMGK